VIFQKAYIDQVNTRNSRQGVSQEEYTNDFPSYQTSSIDSRIKWILRFTTTAEPDNTQGHGINSLAHIS
jgi:hypothetical protein